MASSVGTQGRPPWHECETRDAAPKRRGLEGAFRHFGGVPHDVLQPLAAKAPFLQVREFTRRVHTDAPGGIRPGGKAICRTPIRATQPARAVRVKAPLCGCPGIAD